MALFKRKPSQHDLISSEDLALYGRREFLGEASGIESMDAWKAIEPLNQERYRPDGNGTQDVINELRRHASRGPWEAVGAWKFARDFLQEPDNAEFIDAGLQAVIEMRITNLAIHLPPVDLPRYEQLAGGRPPNDGFFGPPTFDSAFGPTRQFYFDNALTAGAARRVNRLVNGPGIPPGPLLDAARSMWDFGMFVYRGPLLVGPDYRFEPSLVRVATEAATGVDHRLVVEGFASELRALGDYHWAYMGSSRFLEDYLDPALTGSPEHAVLVDAGLRELEKGGLLGTAFPLDILSPFERERLSALGPDS